VNPSKRKGARFICGGARRGEHSRGVLERVYRLKISEVEPKRQTDWWPLRLAFSRQPPLQEPIKRMPAALTTRASRHNCQNVSRTRYDGGEASHRSEGEREHRDVERTAVGFARRLRLRWFARTGPRLRRRATTATDQPTPSQSNSTTRSPPSPPVVASIQADISLISNNMIGLRSPRHASDHSDTVSGSPSAAARDGR